MNKAIEDVARWYVIHTHPKQEDRAVGIHDNFFDLGGRSLLMAQVHSELRQFFNKDFPLVKILEHPTISSLAKYLGEEESEQVSVQQSYERAMKQREGLKRQRESLRTNWGRR